MEIERNEGGKIKPWVNNITDGEYVSDGRADGGMILLHSAEHRMLVEIINGLEYLSRQIAES